MKNILIIGGTRNVGYFLSQRLIAEGHRLTILNRGVTPVDLPDSVHRLICDRTDARQMHRAVANRDFDAVIDMALYKEQEAETVVDLFRGRVDHYIAISSGQVYLVRDGASRPYVESDYDGELIPEPERNTYDHEEWLYGMGKRGIEDTLYRAEAAGDFPVTTLRLPMVNSERDSFRRLYGYILRVQDGGPVLVPQTPNHPLRHVYGGDVVNVVMALLQNGTGKGRAYNVSQDETLSIDDFLHLLGEVMGKKPDIRYIERETLEGRGFLPDCSPFSDLWMSELDNTLSKAELGIAYTPVRAYLERIVAYHRDNHIEPPVSYRRRKSEKALGNGN